MTSKRGFLKGMLAAPAAAVIGKEPTPTMGIPPIGMDAAQEGYKITRSSVDRVKDRVARLKDAVNPNNAINPYISRYHDPETITYVPDNSPIAHMKSLPPWKKVDMYRKEKEQQRIRRMESELMTLEELLKMPESFIDEIVYRFL